jgi:hypothetical protein
MSSITFSSDEEIYALSISNRGNASNTFSPSTLNDSTSSSSNSYTPEQLNRFLLRKNENFRLNNSSTKTLASWWHTFGYVTTKNKRNEFERINGFISCFKAYESKLCALYHLLLLSFKIN